MKYQFSSPLTGPEHPLHRVAGMAALATSALLTVVLLVGCASPEPRYYTLASVTRDDRALPPLPTHPLWIQVAPVSVPESLNRTQLVMHDGAHPAALKRLEFARWSAPLPDELRDALSLYLQLGLGAIDTYRQGQSGTETLYRVSAEVIRLDAVPGRQAVAVINWTVRRQPEEWTVFSSTRIQLPIADSIDDVVAAYRKIVAAVASDIAFAVRIMER